MQNREKQSGRGQAVEGAMEDVTGPATVLVVVVVGYGGSRHCQEPPLQNANMLQLTYVVVVVLLLEQEAAENVGSPSLLFCCCIVGGVKGEVRRRCICCC